MLKIKKDPYQTLGVGKDASKEQVKRAYRKKAKATHPDRNGDADEFREVHKAYLILSDDTRRKRYDETGDTDTTPDNGPGELFQILRVTFLNVLKGLVERGKKPSHTHIVKLMRENLENDLHKISVEIGQLHKTEADLKDIAERLRDKEDGFIGSIIQEQQGLLQSHLSKVQGIKKNIDDVLEYLKVCGYRIDDEAAVNGFVRIGDAVFTAPSDRFEEALRHFKRNTGG